jgi:hypothetical protein
MTGRESKKNNFTYVMGEFKKILGNQLPKNLHVALYGELANSYAMYLGLNYPELDTSDGVRNFYEFYLSHILNFREMEDDYNGVLQN